MRELTRSRKLGRSINATIEAMEQRTLLSAVIGSPGSYLNDGNTAAKAFDGNLNTFFDAANPSGDYTGEDFGSPVVVQQISYAPRSGFAFRMEGGGFQGSSTADFSTGVVTLYTITKAPAAGVLTTVPVTNNTPFRYIRYIGPDNGSCNIAEIKFTTAAAPQVFVDSGNSLNILGTSGNDTINVKFTVDITDDFSFPATHSVNAESFTVTLNGATQTINNNAVTQILVDSGDGNDSITITGAEDNENNLIGAREVNLNVMAGGGNDTIRTSITESLFDLRGFGPNTSILAGDGNDYINVFGGAFATLTAGNGNDTLLSGATADIMVATLTAGNGNDALVADSAGDQGQSVSMSAGTGQDSYTNTDHDDTVTCPQGQLTDQSSTLTGTVTSTEAGNSNQALVFADLNLDGIFDAGDVSDLVGVGGGYQLTGLDGNQGESINPSYNVLIQPPVGYSVVSPATGKFAEAGSLTTGYNFLLAPTTAVLTGTVIGTAGSYQNQGNTAAKAFDGNLSTFFDAPSSAGSYTGLDLGTAKIITQISYAPRSGFASRMIGGVFQGSNSADFSSGVTTLYTVRAAPAAGILTAVQITSTSAFRYVRYVGPAGSSCNVAEIQFTGTAPVIPTVIGTAGSYRNHGTTIANAVDGNLSTYFDAPDASSDWVGLDFGSATVITQVQYAPRSGFEGRMVGGEIQASNTADFSSGVVTLLTIHSAPTAGVLTTQSLNNTIAYQYYRYIGPTNGYCNIAELDFNV